MEKQLQQQVQQMQQLQKQQATTPAAAPAPQQPSPNVQQATQEMEKLRKELQASNVERERFQSQLEMLVQELEKSQVKRAFVCHPNPNFVLHDNNLNMSHYFPAPISTHRINAQFIFSYVFILLLKIEHLYFCILILANYVIEIKCIF